MMKFAKFFPLIAVLGLHLMSNSLSSMAHFTSLPEVYDLCNICFIGCSIGIFDSVGLEVRLKSFGGGHQC